MPQIAKIRTSLEVGYRNGELPAGFLRYRGRSWRAIDAVDEFPYEDAQFDVVMMAGTAVSRKLVKEAHRVLRSEGRLLFVVPEKTGKQPGFTLPDIYSIVREGFNITEVIRLPWWKFWVKDRTITICANKKNWKALTNSYRPYV